MQPSSSTAQSGQAHAGHAQAGHARRRPSTSSSHAAQPGWGPQPRAPSCVHSTGAARARHVLMAIASGRRPETYRGREPLDLGYMRSVYEVQLGRKPFPQEPYRGQPALNSGSATVMDARLAACTSLTQLEGLVQDQGHRMGPDLLTNALLLALALVRPDAGSVHTETGPVCSQRGQHAHGNGARGSVHSADTGGPGALPGVAHGAASGAVEALVPTPSSSPAAAAPVVTRLCIHLAACCSPDGRPGFKAPAVGGIQNDTIIRQAAKEGSREAVSISHSSAALMVAGHVFGSATSNGSSSGSSSSGSSVSPADTAGAHANTPAGSRGQPEQPRSASSITSNTATDVVGGFASGRVSGDRRQLDEALCVLLRATRRGLLVAAPAELARLAQGLGYLDLNMEKDWTERFLKVVQARMPDMNGLQLTLVAWSCARLLRHNSSPTASTSTSGLQSGAARMPDAYWVSCLAAATLPHLQTLSAVSLSNLLWAITQWDTHPGAEWVSAAMRALHTALPSMRPDSLAASLRAVRVLHPRPLPVAMLDASMERVLQVANIMQPLHDVQVLQAWEGLQYLPPEPAMQTYTLAMRPRLARYTASELGCLVLSLARRGFLPSTAWLAEWAGALQGVLRSLDSRDVASVLAACASWRVLPPKDLLMAVFEVSLAQARSGLMDPWQATRQLVALADLMLPPSRQMLTQLLSVVTTYTTNLALTPRPGSTLSGGGGGGGGSGAGEAETPQQQLAHAMMLSDLITCLPRLFGLYTRQELQPGQHVAVVVAGDALASPGGAGAAGGRWAQRLEGNGMAWQPTSAATPEGPYASRAAVPETAGLSPKPAGRAAAVARQVAEADTGAPAQSVVAALLEEGVRPDPAALVPRHRSADVIDLLLPPGLAIPLLEGAYARLHVLPKRELYLQVRALALMRLSPGRGFLAAHVTAMGAHLPTMTPMEKLKVDACYQILMGDPSCLRLEVVPMAQPSRGASARLG